MFGEKGIQADIYIYIHDLSYEGMKVISYESYII